MRILTIGVLIVTGGTLASLPFRRQAPTDPSDGRSDPVSGRPDSELVAEPWPFHTSDQTVGREAFPTLPEVSMATPPGEAELPPQHAARRRTRQPPPLEGELQAESESQKPASDPNRARPPSYDDFLLPIEESRVLRDRFSATFGSADEFENPGTAGRADAAESDPPTREIPHDASPAVASPASLRRDAVERSPSLPPSLSASDDPLPELEDDVERNTTSSPKHWIRQPQ